MTDVARNMNILGFCVVYTGRERHTHTHIQKATCMLLLETGLYYARVVLVFMFTYYTRVFTAYEYDNVQ